MKFYVTIIGLFVWLNSVWAEKDLSPSYQIDSTLYNAQLNEGEALYYFTFHNLPSMAFRGGKQTPIFSHVITYAYDGNNYTSALNKENQLEIRVKPGNYSFQFYYNNQHEEIYTGTIRSKSRHSTFVSCFLQPSEHRVVCEKPVIYLYPEKETDVHVEVVPKGSFTFTYPNYKNGWDVTASPNGELNVDGKSFNYLFWESDQVWNPRSQVLFEGSVVERENITQFLEDRLDEFGLTTKEKADFITFWAPRLMRHNLSFIHFMVNDDADEFADLKISPEPDHIYRIYMISYPMDGAEDISSIPQHLNKIDRSGFTVIEWGGTEIAFPQP
jgi:hypothetical protein